jgi:TonB-dependent starch-binding outer membrane protein SusC
MKRMPTYFVLSLLALLLLGASPGGAQERAMVVAALDAPAAPPRAESQYQSVRSESGRIAVLNRPISVRLEAVTLKEALDQIALRGDLRLTYSDDLLPPGQRVTLRADRLAVGDALLRVVAPTELDILVAPSRHAVVVRQPRRESHGPEVNLLGPSLVGFRPDAVLVPHEMMRLVRQGTVMGTVTEAGTGRPIAGANVRVATATTGTVTASDGRFLLTGVAAGIQSIRVSMIGYRPAEQAVTVTTGQTTTLNFQLVADAVVLQEVVAVGYGTQLRRNVPGSIATVRGDQLGTAPSPSPIASLQGRAAGVQVSTGSGVPGASSRMLVRGTSSISAGTEPLIIVDGMPVANQLEGRGGVNSFAALNENDIESIDILKDAAATAIYGSRGANGVVLITTRSGRGAGRTTMNVRMGRSNELNMVQLADARQWLGMVDEAWANDGLPGQWAPINTATGGGLGSGLVSTWVPDRENALTRAMVDQIAASGGTDWLSPIWRTNGAFDREISLATSRGFDGGAFFLSGTFRDEEGLLLNQELRSYGLRANLEFRPSSRLNTGIRSTFSYNQNFRPPLSGGSGATVPPAATPNLPGRADQGVRGSYATSRTGAVPVLPIRNADGSFFDPRGGRNVVAAMDTANHMQWADQYRVLGTAFLEYDLLQGLRLRAQGGADLVNNTDRLWTGTLLRASPYATQNDQRDVVLTYVTTANFDRRFDRHSFNSVVGLERQRGQFVGGSIRAEALTGQTRYIGNPGAGLQLIEVSQGRSRESRLHSTFARVNYTLDDRYLVLASLRRDGASVFGADNRYGIFPAVGLGWVLSEEGFARGLSAVDVLRLRTSYGRTGNASIPFALENNIALSGMDYGGFPAARTTSIGTPLIGWENTTMFDAGFDFGVFGNRVSGSVNTYRQDVASMLLQVPIAPSQGIIGTQSVWQNIGTLRNSGVEFQLSGTVIELPNGLTWRSDVNVSRTGNRVQSLTPQLDANPLGVVSGRTVTRTGGKLATYFLAESAGVDPETGLLRVWARDQEHYAATGETRRTGDMLPATSQNISNNRMILEGRTGLPGFNGGFNNAISYRGIQLSALLTFQGGNYLYDETHYGVSAENNIRADYMGRYWRPDNRDAQFPRLTLRGVAPDGTAITNGSGTDLYLQKGDFVRLRNVQLSYDLPAPLARRLASQSARAYISASNLHTWTGFEGYDPEVARFDSDNQNRNLQQGIIGGVPFPQVRTVSAGLQVSF